MFWNKKTKETNTLIITEENFQELVTNNPLPVLIDFWAPWCGPCRIMGPIIDELAGDYSGRVAIGKINVDKNPALSQYFKVKSIPTLMFVKNGQLIERFSKLIPKPNLEEMLDDLLVLKVPAVHDKNGEEE